MLSLDQLAVEMAVSFIVTQLGRYGTDINVAQAKTHAHAVLKDTIHESWFEGACESMVDALIDAVPVICQNVDDVKALILDVATGQMPAAITAMKTLLVKVLPPSGEYTGELVQMLKAA